MRLWSIHPHYLDAKGLVALWREGLLAQAVLQGKTKGYRYHPQLIRFKETKNSIGAIASYLIHIADEAEKRGYHFDRTKITKYRYKGKIKVSRGQLTYEFTHLLKKIKIRDNVQYLSLKETKQIKTHPLFRIVSGDVAEWEVTKKK